METSFFLQKEVANACNIGNFPCLALVQLYTIKILISAQAFIRITTFHKQGGRHLLEATVFDNSLKNFEIFKFSSSNRHIDIGNRSIY